jgi:hypothetical protein
MLSFWIMWGWGKMAVSFRKCEQVGMMKNQVRNSKKTEIIPTLERSN